MSSVLNLPNERRMLDVVRDGLKWADEACFAVSFTRCSGLGLLVDPLRELVERAGKVQLLTSTYQCVTQPAALQTLLRLKGVETFLQDGAKGFHSKFWLFDSAGARGECWAGSSNLSKGGLADNLEWNLKSAEREIVSQTRRQFDALLRRPDVGVLSESLIERYALRYEEAALAQQLPTVAEGARPFAPQPNEAQREALQRLENMVAAGLTRAAIIAATGIGKTYLAAFFAERIKAKNVLFVSHRLEHLTQAERAFRQVLDDEVRCEFLTIQSLRNRPELLKTKWDVLIVDEFHHVEADGYRPLRAIRDNGHTFLLGMTATPERQDGRDILEWCDWNIAWEVRLPEAIERDWLLPFHYFAIADEQTDFLSINWRGGMTAELEALLSVDRRAELILEQAQVYGFDGPKRATVGFCAGIEHAKFMARAFNARGETALAVWGQHEVGEREAVYRRLADPTDALQWLFVADVLNEGVDIPAINSLLFLRPTESSSIFLQQLGRGLRLTPGCEVLTVLDFVGHHRRSWVALQAIDGFTNTGVPVEVGDLVVRPPKSCEVVLQRKTIEMLEKINRHSSRRVECDEAYLALKNELGRSPLPIDLWQRDDLPSFKDFRAAYGDWLACQAANHDLPAWAGGLEKNAPLRQFLRAMESDWQAQRVHAYATAWGLAGGLSSFEDAYDAFFERFPQWKVERVSPYPLESVHGTFGKKVPGGLITSKGLAPAVLAILDSAQLQREVEGRLLATLNRAFEERHGGVIRRPEELSLHHFYRRPEIVRHFGVNYDPARHNTGVLSFGNHLAILTKLDTSGAKESFQYANRFIGSKKFEWTSQNRMRHDSNDGLRLIEHVARGLHVHLFVQANSHAEAVYVGEVKYASSTGDGPMQVTFALERAVPEAVMKQLLG